MEREIAESHNMEQAQKQPTKLTDLLDGASARKHDILRLPHTPDGYEEAKKIFQANYGKDIKVRKALIQELEGLGQIVNVKHSRDIHEFYNKLARIVRTLATMKKLQTAQGHVYTVMDKLGPIREALVSKDDDWEEWDLEELVEKIRGQASSCSRIQFTSKKNNHRSKDCFKVLDVEHRKEFSL
eukprot:gene14885-16430_t